MASLDSFLHSIIAFSSVYFLQRLSMTRDISLHDLQIFKFFINFSFWPSILCFGPLSYVLASYLCFGPLSYVLALYHVLTLYLMFWPSIYVLALYLMFWPSILCFGPLSYV